MKKFYEKANEFVSLIWFIALIMFNSFILFPDKINYAAFLLLILLNIITYTLLFSESAVRLVR